MFPSLLISALLALPLAAQSSNGHGLKVGGIQSTELFDLKPLDHDQGSRPRVIYAQFETWVEQLPRDHVEGVMASFAGTEETNGKASIGRLILDHLRKVQVGYRLTVESEPEKNGYRVAFEDFSGTAAPAGWTIVSPPSHPVPQFFQNGDVLKVDLYARPNGSKLVEYVRIGTPGVRALRADAPHDAYAEDAEFTISHPKFSANGLPVTSAQVEDFHSPVLRVRIPGYGSYLLTLKPHPNFENAGEVSDASLTLMVRGNVFRIDCTDRIASGSAAYNVYAFPDPSAAASATATISAESALGLK